MIGDLISLYVCVTLPVCVCARVRMCIFMCVCLINVWMFNYLIRICSEVVAGVVTKCLGGRAKTKESGILICLMFVEIEQYVIVQVMSAGLICHISR